MVEIMRSDTANRTPENRGFRPTTPHNPALRIIDIARSEDAEVRALIRGVLDADEASLDVQGQGADRAGEASAVGSEGADVRHCLIPLFQGRAHRDPMAVVRPEAIDPHPKGWNEVEGGRRRLFWFAMQSRRRRKKVVAGRCGDKIESGVAGRPSVRPSQSGSRWGCHRKRLGNDDRRSRIGNTVASDDTITVTIAPVVWRRVRRP